MSKTAIPNLIPNLKTVVKTYPIPNNLTSVKICLALNLFRNVCSVKQIEVKNTRRKEGEKPRVRTDLIPFKVN